MTDTTNKIIVDVEMRDKLSKKLDRINKKIHNIKKAKANLDPASAAMFKLQTAAKKTADQLKITTKTLDKLQKSKGVVGFMNKTSQSAMKFNGNLLSLMFAGMAMQRVFGGALKSIFEGYKKIIPESHAFNKMTTEMSANWEYFKFQLADALANSSLFQRFVQFIINTLQWLQKLSPETKKWIVVLLGVGLLLGGLLVLITMVGLGFAGIYNIINGLGALTFLTTIPTFLSFNWTDWGKTIATAVKKIPGLFKTSMAKAGGFFTTFKNSAIGQMIIVYAAWKTMTWLMSTSLKKRGREIDDNFAAMFIALGITAGTGILGVAMIIIGGVIAAAASILDVFYRLGSGVWDALKAGMRGEGISAMKDEFMAEFSAIPMDIANLFNQLALQPTLKMGMISNEMIDNLSHPIQQITDDVSELRDLMQTPATGGLIDDIKNFSNARNDLYSMQSSNLDGLGMGDFSTLGGGTNTTTTNVVNLQIDGSEFKATQGSDQVVGDVNTLLGELGFASLGGQGT